MSIFESSLFIHLLFKLPYNMASFTIAINIDDGDSNLTTLNSRDTPLIHEATIPLNFKLFKKLWATKSNINRSSTAYRKTKELRSIRFDILRISYIIRREKSSMHGIKALSNY